MQGEGMNIMGEYHDPQCSPGPTGLHSSLEAVGWILCGITTLCQGLPGPPMLGLSQLIPPGAEFHGQAASLPQCQPWYNSHQQHLQGPQVCLSVCPSVHPPNCCDLWHRTILLLEVRSGSLAPPPAAHH